MKFVCKISQFIYLFSNVVGEKGFIKHKLMKQEQLFINTRQVIFKIL